MPLHRLDPRALAIILHKMLSMMYARNSVRIQLAINKLVHVLLELRFDLYNIVVDPVSIVLGDTVLDDACDVALVVGSLDPVAVVIEGPVDGDFNGGCGCGADVPETHGVLLMGVERGEGGSEVWVCVGVGWSGWVI